jgi:hypothetical protein
MTPAEAAYVIEAMARALRANPQQFHINVSVIGQRVSSYGGTGMVVNAVGGGPGSTTIGNQVTMGGAHVELSPMLGGQAMDQQFGVLLQTLEGIVAELRSPKPDRSRIGRAIDTLKDTWVPGAIVSTVVALIAKALGLG